MSCPCQGTWRHPCAECYQSQLRGRIAEQAAGPTAEELELALRKCDVPGAILAALRVQLIPNDYLKAARAFFKAPNQLQRTAVFLGPPGKGKSVAAGWLMREVLKDLGWNNAPTGGLAFPARFVSAAQLTRISSYDKLDSDWLNDLHRVRLLVVDDAGDEATAIGKDTLGGLLLDRHNKLRRTVITSNLRRAALTERYGGALLDRATGEGVLIESAGQSMRQKEARP